MNARLTLTIARRELRAQVNSALAHVVLCTGLVIMGLFFVNELSIVASARLDGWFASSSVVILFLAPLLSMRSLADEQRTGSLDILLAGPVDEWSIVVGKYLGLATVYGAFVAATFPVPVLVAWWGDPDPGPIVTGYLGLVLLGLASLAVALFASSLSAHQVVAAAMGFALLLVLWLLQGLSGAFAGTARDFLAAAGSTQHLESFRLGLVRAPAVAYYVSLVVLGLLGAVRSLQMRRLR